MDENKIPEQEDSWLDDVLGPESAGAELGPDASVLFNTHLTDPGAPAEEMSDFYEEFPEDLPIADILPIPDGSCFSNGDRRHVFILFSHVSEWCRRGPWDILYRRG